MAARKSLERDIYSLYFMLERIDDLKIQYELAIFIQTSNLPPNKKQQFIQRGVFPALSQTVQSIGERSKGLTDSTKMELTCIDFSELRELRNLISHNYAGTTIYRGKSILMDEAKSTLYRSIMAMSKNLTDSHCITAIYKRLNHCKKVVANRQNQESTNTQNGYGSYKPHQQN